MAGKEGAAGVGVGDRAGTQVDPRAASFARLTSARLAACYRLAAAILGDAVEAEDATHDAAVRAWQRSASLRRILINECRDRLRRRKSELRSPLFVGGRGAGPADLGDSLAEQQALAEALDRLEPEHRIVIVLRFYQGLDDREIAVRTGARPGTVKSRMHYALQALRAARDAVARIDEVSR